MIPRLVNWDRAALDLLADELVQKVTRGKLSAQRAVEMFQDEAVLACASSDSVAHTLGYMNVVSEFAGRLPRGDDHSVIVISSPEVRELRRMQWK